MSSDYTNTLLDLFDIFPTLEADFNTLYISCVLKEIDNKTFDSVVKDFLASAKNRLQIIRQGIKSDKNMAFAYYDVARYQTDITDAAIEWQVDERLLRFILTKRPPPETPEGRHLLTVPHEVVKIREVLNIQRKEK
jgi:hypothetical protein